MGKGSCKKSVPTKEQERTIERTKTPDQKSVSVATLKSELSKNHSKNDLFKEISRRESKESEKGDPNTKLIKYTEAILADPYNHSLTKEHITLELAQNLAHVRTADNAGLGLCIYINYKNNKIKFPYAISADCYCVFCDFFGPLIEAYHGPAINEALFEPVYGDIEKYSRVDLNLHERNRIIYSDIIVRRNIGGQPFSPLIKPPGRKDIINKLEKIFKTIFENESEVAHIPSEWLQRFDAIKNELDDIGAMRDYPDDRLHMIFESVEKTHQGIVLNFDDHLQIITSCNDGRIGQLYKAMYDIYTNENLDKVDFIVHPLYGFLTISPVYIGTGMTIRIIAKFPFLSQMVDLERCILKKYEVTAKVDGSPCEPTGLITISNRHSFNKTEENIINDVIDAYWLLCELEDELEKTSPMSIQRDILPVESFKYLYDKISKSESKGYTKKYLTPNVILHCENARTMFDNTFSICIRSSAYYPDSLFPRAADGDCYSKYRQFFAPILYETNKIQSPSHPHQPDYGVAADHKVHMLHHPDITSYRVRFSRNFDRYPFPMTMSDNQRRDVENILIKVFDEFPMEIEGEYCPLAKVNTSVYLEKLLQYHLLPNFNKVEVSSGCYRNWPKHRGFFVAKNDPKFPALILIILVNITEHIKVVCLDTTGKSLYGCYDRAVKVMHILDLRFDKIFSRKIGFGFLTSFPQSVGCGLRISAMVYLKYLGDNREIFESLCKESQFAYRGTNGAGSPAIGNVFDISLKVNMNISEQMILLKFCQNLKEMILIEREYNCQIPKPSNKVYVESVSDDLPRSLDISTNASTIDSTDTTVSKRSLARASKKSVELKFVDLPKDEVK